jgi:hypothetical protein
LQAICHHFDIPQVEQRSLFKSYPSAFRADWTVVNRLTAAIPTISCTEWEG